MLNPRLRMAVTIALTLLACVAGSLAGAWLVSRLLGFSLDASHVAAISGALGGVAIARELRRARKGTVCTAP